MIIGIALIVLSWTLFKSLGLFLWASIVLTVVGSILAFFGLLFIVYFFNLDMKLTSFLESKFIKLYDKQNIIKFLMNIKLQKILLKKAINFSSKTILA